MACIHLSAEGSVSRISQHTHTHTHTCTHARSHTHVHAHAHTHTHTHSHMCTRAHSHMRDTGRDRAGRERERVKHCQRLCVCMRERERERERIKNCQRLWSTLTINYTLNNNWRRVVPILNGKASSVKLHIFIKTATRWTDHACDTSATARAQRSQTVVS